MGSPAGPALEVIDYAGPYQWNWRLTCPDGSVLGHPVRIDPESGPYQAFAALPDYLRLYASPDQSRADEARLIVRTGRWVATDVLGPVGAALAALAPGTVRIIVPRAAVMLAALPFELAIVGNIPLSEQGLVIVYETVAEHPARSGDERPATDERPAAAGRPVAAPLRMLVVLSAPAGTSALTNNTERDRLRALPGAIGLHPSVDVHVVQYGVTRAALAEVIAQPGGWDVVHLSGHGTAGRFALETSAGGVDETDADALAGLLAPVRGRLRLLTVAACSSAGAVIADTLRVLGWTSGDAVPSAGAEAPVLALNLADRLGCAVLGMRYPVADRFAAAFTADVYERMLAGGDVLPAAVAGTAASYRDSPSMERWPVLTLAAPVIYGTAAAELRFAPGPLSPGERPATGPADDAPHPPPWFVGRVSVLATAGAALWGPDAKGVLLTGMPGSGKTACALELAARHRSAFEHLVWFQVPGSGASSAAEQLELFGSALESRIPECRLAGLTADPAALSAAGAAAADHPALIVVDNCESLLNGEGTWSDPRWAAVLTALTGAPGTATRLLLTSRGTLPGLAGIRDIPVGPLSRDESLLMVRALPNLSTLIEASLPDIRPAQQRRLAARSVLTAAGHPYLLKLADAQAADPARLAELLGAAGPAWPSGAGLPEGFFREKGSAEEYTDVLQRWALTVLRALPDRERMLCCVVSCLEAADRVDFIIRQVWPDIWRSLGDVEPGRSVPGLPDPEVFAALEKVALVTVLPGRHGADVHPLIAETGRAEAGSALRDAVDQVLARFWVAVFTKAQREETTGAAGDVLLRAAYAALPYLRRRGDTVRVVRLAEHILYRDSSRKAAAQLLPVLQGLAGLPRDSDDAAIWAHVLAQASRAVGAGDSERRYRDALSQAIAQDDYAGASIAAGSLAQLLADTGHYQDAMAIAIDKAQYSRQAGLGPWTRLADESIQLRIKAMVLPPDQIVAEFHQLWAYAERLRTEAPADAPVPEEIVLPWDVEEGILFLGFDIALRLDQYAESLGYLDQVTERKKQRGAGDVALASTRFNAHGPLSELGRFDEARAVLRQCRQIYEEAGQLADVGLVLSSLAHVESLAGNFAEAVTLEADALRFKYRYGTLEQIEISHHNLGNHLIHDGGDTEQALAHHAAAALIGLATGKMDDDQHAEKSVAHDLDRFAAAGRPPPAWLTRADPGQLAARVDAVAGVHLRSVLEGRGDLAALLSAVYANAVTAQAAVARSVPAHLATWDPVIDALRLAAAGEPGLYEYADSFLEREYRSRDWRLVVLGLRALYRGEPPPPALDSVDAAILDRARQVLDGQLILPDGAWQALPLSATIGAVVSILGGQAAPGVAEALDEGLQALAAEPAYAATARAIRALLGTDGDAEGNIELDPAGFAAVSIIIEHAGLPSE